MPNSSAKTPVGSQQRNSYIAPHKEQVPKNELPEKFQFDDPAQKIRVGWFQSEKIIIHKFILVALINCSVISLILLLTFTCVYGFILRKANSTINDLEEQISFLKDSVQVTNREYSNSQSATTLSKVWFFVTLFCSNPLLKGNKVAWGKLLFPNIDLLRCQTGL